MGIDGYIGLRNIREVALDELRRESRGSRYDLGYKVEKFRGEYGKSGGSHSGGISSAPIVSGAFYI